MICDFVFLICSTITQTVQIGSNLQGYILHEVAYSTVGRLQDLGGCSTSTMVDSILNRLSAVLKIECC